MQCSLPHLARPALWRPAHSLTSSAPGPFIRARSTHSTARTSIASSPGALWRAKNHTAAKPRKRPTSTTRPDREAKWKLCHTIQTLVRNNSMEVALHDLAKLPLSSISPRRSSHIILHGLLRKGYVSEASFYAQHSLNRGISLRTRSLEAVVIGMVHSVEAEPPTETVEFTTPLNGPAILNLAPATNQSPDITRSALALYEAERLSGKRPSDRMFKYLMVLFILNGEIILASLLFGTFMREWQARDMAVSATGHSPTTQPAPNSLMAQNHLRQLCRFMNDFLKPDFTDTTSRVLHSASLQALAQLAYSLDHGQLQYGDLNFLLKTMLLCPRGPAKVWIPGDSPDDPPQYVNAYKYIHDVLARLINDLPLRRRNVHYHRHADFTWLHGRDYVKLIEYTLKHRQSLEATRGILRFILDEGNPRILQMAELRNVIAHAAPSFPRGAIHDLMSDFGLENAPLKWNRRASDFTYSTTINAMMKAGQSAAVMDAIPTLLPGLFYPQYDESMSELENRILRKNLKEEGLRRGVLLGPVVFVCLMNAARSLGNTKYCERIFNFALEAQEQSWNPVPGYVPWCLPAHAYTLMVRMYAHEMNFGMDSEAHMWGDWKPNEQASRPEMGRRMILATVRRMVQEARQLEERLNVVTRWKNPAWRGVPYPDGFLFNALIQAFERTPDDPVFAALKVEMEAEGYRPPTTYLKTLKLRKERVHDDLDVGQRRTWREPKDVRPYALPERDYFKEKHEPALFTKKLTKRLLPEIDL